MDAAGLLDDGRRRKRGFSVGTAARRLYIYMVHQTGQLRYRSNCRLVFLHSFPLVVFFVRVSFFYPSKLLRAFFFSPSLFSFHRPFSHSECRQHRQRRSPFNHPIPGLCVCECLCLCDDPTAYIQIFACFEREINYTTTTTTTTATREGGVDVTLNLKPLICLGHRSTRAMALYDAHRPFQRVNPRLFLSFFLSLLAVPCCV